MGRLDDKLDRLRQRLLALGPVAIAFSGGVDSTFLAVVAQLVLHGRCLAVTCRGPVFPNFELKDTLEICRKFGIRQRIVDFDPLADPDFSLNPPERCYHCKRGIIAAIGRAASEEGFSVILDGTNFDDTKDFRPGLRALAEAGVISPLRECGFGKADIRRLSADLGLATFTKPSFACYASRIPYGTEITMQNLNQVRQAEEFLRDLGHESVRVRHHGDIARIEIPDFEIEHFVREHRTAAANKLKALGFTYVAIDLEGFRTGSMTEVLRREEMDKKHGN